MVAFTQDRNIRLTSLKNGVRAHWEGTDESRALAAVMAMCRSALTGGVHEMGDVLAGIGSPEVFAALVDRARLWSACDAGFARSGIPVPEFMAARVRAEREQAMLANTRVLFLARAAFPCFERRAIPAIAFKGPFHQRQLHGDWFTRRSSDLDILVPRARFDEALGALEAIGFRIHHGTSQWWKFSLGEVHLAFPGGGVIDLHHRLQQPGCPAPRDLQDFLDQAQTEQLGEAAIAIPSLPHALLISALNFCKELFHRKPSARYAFDFAAGALRLPPDSHPGFAALVRRQGLEGPVGFVLAACERLYGPLPGLSAAGERHSDAARWLERIDFPRLVFAPHSDEVRWPRRRAFLWQFCGGQTNARCSLDFAAQASRIAFGEVLRASAPITPRVAG